ncbi:ATP-binding protein [Amycolatopsis kentuckyensis]|uniref:ATP-binding protein n=1 Tax=Amycolatopsis kentuckyensis TaxID=218823 RepID=UPI000A3AC270|nr:ATP-binding protein [Amycolatopsis kentuckyensis]
MSEFTAEELLRQLKEWQEDAPARAFAEFDDGTLCLLGLLPEWTPELAGRLGLHWSGVLAEFVERLAQADLVEYRQAAGGVLRSFWVRPHRRRELGDYLRDRMDPMVVVGFYEEVCTRVAGQRLPELRTWLQVRDFQADPSGGLLLDRIETLLREDDLPAAATVVTTSRVVGEIIGGPLEDAVKRAKWRLDREYRTRDDLGHLDGYHRRAEIEGALTDLVTRRDERWAVHLFGNAGVGKTMTVRYLASGKLAEDHGIPRFPVARVDFDHLDPRYPERRPAELLLAMTDELLGFATSRGAEHRYRAVRDAADAVHEELSRSDPDRSSVEDLRVKAINRFAEFLGELPSPVVLVLDTCEELAKLYAAGASAPAIDQTFDLLERLHKRNSGVRVVLAGRRYLVKPDDASYSGPILHRHDYVRVVPMRGFTRDDALGYFGEREIPERLHRVLLERSADGDRYNPFELAGLCDWVRDESNFDLAALAATVVDPYVERRILSRIQDRDVLAALPVAVALGAFDRALITPALTRLGVDVAAAFDGLSAQEWVQVRHVGDDGMPRVIEVDEHLRERLRAVLERSDRPAADLAALGRDAAAVIRRGPLPEVATATVLAAVRLLPPAEAGVLWDEIDDEILRHGEWAWALQVAPRVAAMERARIRDHAPTVLAAVLATEASARIHSGHHEGLAALWDTVGTHAVRHPAPSAVHVLVSRAELGEIAAGNLRDRLVVHQPPDAALAALEAMVAASLDVTDDVLRLIETLGPGDRSIADGAFVMLAGRWLQSRDVEGIAELLDERLAAFGADREPEVWPDWVAPRGLGDRLRLGRVLIALHGGKPLDEETQRRWRDEANGGYGDIDSDRLYAALVDYRLAHTVDFAPAGSLTIPPGEPVPWLHSGFARALVIVLADALTLQGHYADAARILNDHRAAAVAAGDQAEIITACDLALLRLCRAARSTQYAPVQGLAYDGSPRLRDEAWLVLRLLGEADDPRWAEYCSPYGRWRCDPSRGEPPDPTGWAVDHLDIWESAPYADGAQFPVGGVLAEGRGYLMSGEIQALLGSRAEAGPLLRHARSNLAAGGCQRGVDYANELLLQPPARPEPADPSRWRLFADWARSRFAVAGQSVHGFGYRFRRLRATRTVAEFVFWLVVGTLFGCVGAGVVAFFGGSPFWMVVVGLVPLVFYLAVCVSESGRMFETRRVVLAPDGEHLAVTVFPHQEPEKFGREPRRSRERDRLATAVWTDEFEWDGTELPEAIRRVPLFAEPWIAVDVFVVLLDAPRDLQFIGSWERALTAGLSARVIARLVLVRWLPGVRRTILLQEWRERSEAFHGPVRLRPGRAWNDVPGPRRLVQLVGTPVRSSAGWQIRVRDASGQAARETSRGAEHREELFDLQTVTREKVALLVLQAEPADGPPRPLDSDHDGFVRAAAAAMDNAADAVLVLPPLPDDLAKDAVDLIWRSVGRAEVLNAAKLTGLVASLKTMVYKAERPAADACVDVLVFMRSQGGP